MRELPKKFPEYVTMYKTLTKQIETLEQRKETAPETNIEEIESKIQKYKSEKIRIEERFPDKFFEELN